MASPSGGARKEPAATGAPISRKNSSNPEGATRQRICATCFGSHFDLSIDHIKGFVEIWMGVWSRTTAGRYEHVNVYDRCLRLPKHSVHPAAR